MVLSWHARSSPRSNIGACHWSHRPQATDLADSETEIAERPESMHWSAFLQMLRVRSLNDDNNVKKTGNLSLKTSQCKHLISVISVFEDFLYSRFYKTKFTQWVRIWPLIMMLKKIFNALFVDSHKEDFCFSIIVQNKMTPRSKTAIQTEIRRKPYTTSKVE